MPKDLEHMGDVLLDERQKPKDAVKWYYLHHRERSKYKPHAGAKEYLKAKRRLQKPERA